MTSYSAASARAEMSELRRLKSLLPPELQSWVTVETTVEVNPPLVRSEELGKDQVEIQIDLVKWERLALDQRNLLFWHEVARVQNDTISRDGWEMAALAIGLGGAVGELWVQDGLLLILALGLCGKHHGVLQQCAFRRERGNFATGAKSRIDGEHAFAAERWGKQEVAQIL